MGPPIPGLELRLATDGEVQCRGGNIFRGYLEDPERTAEALSPDGWFTTGDIGELDPVGYLRIVDRKKELIITAGGKNISPANIEAALRAQPLIGQACVFGDGQPFVVGLLVLDPDVAPAWAATHGVTDTAFDALARDPVVLAEVGREVDEANERFAHAEHVQEVEAPPRGVAARLRGAHSHDEAQATRDRGEVRGRDRGAIRLTRPRRSRACARCAAVSSARPARDTELRGVERVGGVARDAGRHCERVADRARTQLLADSLGHGQRTRLGGVDEHRDCDDVADAEQGVALAQGAPGDGAEGGDGLVARGGRCGFEAVDLPEDDRDRQDLPAGGGHHLLQQHGQVPLAEQAGDGVDLPLLGARGEVAGQIGVVLLRPRRAAAWRYWSSRRRRRDLRARLEQGSVGVRPAHVEEGSDPGGRDTDHRGGECEDCFVGDDRDDADCHREHGEHRAHGDAAVAVGPEILVRRPVRGSARCASCARSRGACEAARSAMMSVRRKSFGV